MNTRSLNFQKFSEVLEELNKLTDVKVRTTGLWTFFQILEYCKQQIEYSIHGYPKSGVLGYISRKLFGSIKLHSILKNGIAKDADSLFLPKERQDGNEREAMQGLKNSIESFLAHKGKMAVHPVYNTMDKSSYERYFSILLSNYLEYVFIVEGYDRNERSEKVDRIKEELLKNLNSKIEKKESETKITTHIEQEELKSPESVKSVEDPISNPETKVSDITSEQSVEVTRLTEDANEVDPSILPEKETAIVEEETTKPIQKTVSKKKTISKKKTVSKKKAVSKKKTVSKKKVAKKK